MANELLKIDEEALQKQVTLIKDAVGDYKNFGDKPFEESIEALNDMNTDFLAKFRVMLGDLNDSNGNVIKELEEIASLAEEILKTFQKIDDDAAASMGFTREG
ncbi:MAG: hypothetical protein K2K56_09165 [Lachnospiraceae bacterium]|nr:hypothetical protein [Lachnospiraceae bacterium]